MKNNTFTNCEHIELQKEILTFKESEFNNSNIVSNNSIRVGLEKCIVGSSKIFGKDVDSNGKEITESFKA